MLYVQTTFDYVGASNCLSFMQNIFIEFESQLVQNDHQFVDMSLFLVISVTECLIVLRLCFWFYIPHVAPTGGFCVQPGECRCQPGYSGENCAIGRLNSRRNYVSYEHALASRGTY